MRFMRMLYFLLAAVSLFGQSSTYLGPKAPVPGNPKLVRVVVLVQDSQELAGVSIHSVSFNQTDIPLKPRDIHGYRGGASFQLPPGEYPLEWVIQRDKTYWPRKITHKEIVTISPKDMWIQIQIIGDQASID